MAKILTKAVTRLQKFLAAIAGDATAPIPVTNQEKLLFNIAEEMKAASSSELPKITAANDGQVLTAYSGEWVAANPSSGGGVLVVTDTDGTLDKTWQEIKDAFDDGEIRVELGENNVGAVLGVAAVGGGTYGVCVCDATERTPFKVYFAESASSYPSLQG